jgi:predicted MFS family arabinose efflux permease
MLHASRQLYGNAYSGLSTQIWRLALVMFINRRRTMVIPFLTAYRGQYAAVYTMSFSAAIVLASTLASQVIKWLGFPMLWVIDFIVCSFAHLVFSYLKKR